MRRKFSLWTDNCGRTGSIVCRMGLLSQFHIGTRFEGVTVGASDVQVRHLLGRPSRIEPCGKSFGVPKPNCTEYLCRNSFAPLVPEYYSVRLDGSSHVIEKYVYESP
jgi:hypothetical protein